MNETEQNPSQEMEKSDDGSGPSKELESIRSRFADALYFLMPGVYHHLLTLSHGPWPHSAALEVSILQWLEDILLSGERCEPRHQHLLEDDGRMLHVLARHLMDDYWWVSVLGLHVILTHDEISGTGPGVAMAIARIKGSGRRLPYPESTDGRPWGQPLKQPEGAPLNLG